jgi:glycosyltransferase involved in cell wall biosynthesis
VVDADRWRTAATPLERPVPLVVHAPSKAAIKGTDLVEPVLESLAADGVIEYRRAEGLSHDEMAALYRSADVVLDQFRLGSYGVTACEAMAAGRVVVAHVDETVRAAVERRAGMPLPIVEATPATLRDVVAGIVHDRAGARERAAAGPRFVSTLHDGRAAADALRDFLLTGAHRRATP